MTVIDLTISFFASCTVLEERADGDGATLRIRGEADAVKRLSAMFARAPEAALKADPGEVTAGAYWLIFIY